MTSPATLLLISAALLVIGCQGHPRSAEATPSSGLTTSPVPPLPLAASAESAPEVDGGPAPSASAAPSMPEPPARWFAFAEDAASRRACRFGGVVRAVETTAVSPGRRGAKRAVRVTVEGDAGRCHGAELAGVQTSMAVGPIAEEWSEQPCTRIVLGVPAGWTLPFGPGDAVCGSVRRYSLGYEQGGEGVVLDAKGALLLAFADAMPRTPSPLLGWTFTLGPERSRSRMDEGYFFSDHDMVIAHAGARWTLREDAEPERLDEKGGTALRAEAGGYRTQGRLSPWMSWLHDAGYHFAVVRERSP
jgi:hypothetical protein